MGVTNGSRQSNALTKLVGTSPAFMKALAPLRAIARSDASALITGETGTGKELVARALHYLSPRAAFPFVPVNCSAFAATLLESELFGHERGAFTGAHMRRHGLIAEAERGTLLLDEVDTLPPKAQATLLRVLQDKRFRMVGSSAEQRSDVRILAATNTQLDELVQAGSFRMDLYYRLCIFSIGLPPLRERKEDILTLANHFLKKHALADMTNLTLAPSARQVLLSYDWPGNVRELENAIIRGIFYSSSGSIERDDLGLPFIDEPVPAAAGDLHSFRAAKRRAVETFERTYLARLMMEYNGNVTKAARAIGKERRDLGKLLKKYHLDSKALHGSHVVTNVPLIPEMAADFRRRQSEP